MQKKCWLGGGILIVTVLICVALLQKLDVRHEYSTEGFSRQEDLYEGEKSPNQTVRKLTLQDVLTLAEKGTDLSWIDLEEFVYHDQADGEIAGMEDDWYRCVYGIDDLFSLCVTAEKETDRILSISLSSNLAPYFGAVDLRYGAAEVQKFIDQQMAVMDEAHLPKYLKLEQYNSEQIFPGFRISEGKFDDALCYQLWNEEIPELIVWINEEETVATVAYQGALLRFDISGAFPPSYNAAFHLQDLTNDGYPEVCYFSGNDSWDCESVEDVVIVDITTMDILKIEPFLGALEEEICCTLRSVSEGEAVYEISAGAAEMVVGVLRVIDGSDLAKAKVEVGCRVKIGLKPGECWGTYGNTLRVVVGFTMSNALPGSTLGDVYADFEYDEASKSFYVQNPYYIFAISPNTTVSK